MTRTLRGLFCFCALLIGIATAATPGSFTIGQVMSAPFASSPLAAPSGTAVAWLLNEQGRRNVWVANAPDWKGRKITSFNEDDGQEIAELAWMPDGKSLFFTRGGDFEMGREAPNPALQTERPKQDIWAAYLDGRAAKRLAEGHSPAVSPKGDVVAFVRESQVYFTGLAGGDPVKTFEARGVAELEWSPDGSLLSFVSNRGDHSFVGIYRVASKTLTYLNPTTDRDGFPSWSPDGKQIAYIRIPASIRAFAFGPERSGEPWSVWITDVGSGKSRCAFQAESGMGSVFQPVVAAHQIFWSRDNSLVFPWERTGWLHLYRVAGGAGEAKELTPGDGEVEHVAAAGNTGVLYYSTNIGDIDRRHLFEIDTRQEGAPKQVTHGEAIEFEPAPVADDSALVFLSSSYNQKSHAAVRLRDGETKDLAPETVPAEFPTAQLVKPQAVLITAADGMVIHGQLFRPSDREQGERHPAIVFFHGGSRRQMLLGFHSMYYYSNAYGMNQFLANQGYIVLSVNYRSGIGYGLNFREALNYGATGASEFNDVM